MTCRVLLILHWMLLVGVVGCGARQSGGERQVRFAEARVTAEHLDVDGVRYPLPFVLLEMRSYDDGGTMAFYLKDAEEKPVCFSMWAGFLDYYSREYIYWGDFDERESGSDLVAIRDKQTVLGILQIVKAAYDKWVVAMDSRENANAGDDVSVWGTKSVAQWLVDSGPWATDETRTMDAESQVRTLRTAVRLYWMEHASGCPSFDDLADGDLLYSPEALSADPWGNPYVIECVDETDATITSLGPDGQRGTADDISVGP